MNLKSEMTIKVNIDTFVLAEWVSEVGKEIAMLREYVKTGKKSILSVLRKTGALIKHSHRHNLITTAGRTVLARRIAGNTTYTGAINYGLLGMQASPVPANSSTQLGTEVFRKLAASQTFDNNIAYVDFFYTAGDTNGTYTEFGNVIDGTATVNTGQLFSYVATGGWVKSNAQSLFVSCKYTVS
ncbi:MAG: hypothetical protein NTX85_03310 [Candidatus Nomurabacteria bacterium]|nr:hypothetical protein [Candidatus Nomurabacteria bacterium]MCX6788441.1 hypothetical protein [Candidatus Jorgensenbacteria bacterium]